VPVVSAPQTGDAWAVIERATSDRGAPVVLVGRDVVWEGSGNGEPGSAGELLVASVDPPREVRSRLRLGGTYQLVNAATAVAALWTMADRGWQIRDRDIAAALALTEWPGRFECFGGGPVLVVDGAHNADGVRALLSALDARFPGSRLHFVLGFSRDKPVVDLLAPLAGRAATMVVTAAEHPRALPVRDLSRLLAARGWPAAAAASPAAALETALRSAEPADVVVATGSLFLAAGVRSAWLARSRGPMPECDPPPPRSPAPG
jgi:dihydrofolate synthase/folylpolyglutamate synthase